MKRLLPLVIIAFAAVPAGAFEPAGCGEVAQVLVSVRDAAGMRGHCDFLGSCPAGEATCVVNASVSVSGTGLVEAVFAGPFGDLRCPLRAGECALNATWHLQPGTTHVFDCSATGVAVEVSFSCSLT